MLFYDIMDFEEFKEYHSDKGYFPLGILSVPGKVLNEKQYRIKYEKYLKMIKKQEDKKGGRGSSDDQLWQDIKVKVRTRDRGVCQLMKILTVGELLEIRKNAPVEILKTLDPAHCLPKSKYRSLYYEVDNIYTLNRFSHSHLDEYRDPLTGKLIDKEKVAWWWERILAPHQINLEVLHERARRK